MSIIQDFKAAFQKPNNALIQLILINVLVFLLLIFCKVIFLMAGFPDFYASMVKKTGLTANLSQLIYQPWTLFSYAFAHEDIFQILFNMLFVYWFGSLIEEFIGSSRVTNLYILGGLAGGILYILMYNFIPYFRSNLPNSLMLGASGATYAIVFGAATLLPNYEFRLLFIGFVRIKYIAWFYVVLSFAQIIGTNAGGNIAHLGGAILGYLYIKQLQKGHDWGTPIQAVADWFREVILRKTRPPMRKRSFSEISVNKNASNAKPLEQDDDHIPQNLVDKLLDKISRSGYESLSTEEKQLLFKASKQ